jgi:ankyrin repeat protein
MNDAAMDDLGAAVIANDADRVRSVLETYPELRQRLDDEMPGGDFGATALLTAVNRRNREMIDVLLAAGANINVRSHWWAGGFGVLDGDHGLHDFLIERGAVVDAHAAARLGRIDRLNELLKSNPALVHARGGDGQTPLHFAKSVEVARLLLSHGANIDARDVDHESTPAQWMLSDRQDVARYLVEQGCQTDLLMAAALGDLRLVQKHLDANPEHIRIAVTEEWFPKQDLRAAGTIYNWSLDRGKSAHWVARRFGHDDVYRFLLERTPAPLKLVVACEVGDTALVQTLISEQPHLISQMPTAEHRKLVNAAQDNNNETLQLMLEAGWPIDARGQHNATALHWAGFHGNADMIRALLKHNPPLEARDADFDGTPLFWTIYGSKHGWNCNTGDYVGAVDALVQAGAKLPADRENLNASAAVRAAIEKLG